MSQFEETAKAGDRLAEKARKAGDTKFAALLEQAANAARAMDKL